jgi:uncharacterized membrane protein YtjA (UPF0391 family)
LFLVIALIAGLLGFFDVAGASWFTFEALFFVFVVLFIVRLLLGGRNSEPI